MNRTLRAIFLRTSGHWSLLPELRSDVFRAEKPVLVGNEIEKAASRLALPAAARSIIDPVAHYLIFLIKSPNPFAPGVGET